MSNCHVFDLKNIFGLLWQICGLVKENNVLSPENFYLCKHNSKKLFLC